MKLLRTKLEVMNYLEELKERDLFSCIFRKNGDEFAFKVDQVNSAKCVLVRYDDNCKTPLERLPFNLEELKYSEVMEAL